MNKHDEFLWVQKYRPNTIEDTILPAKLKSVFAEFVKLNNIPNMILTGGAGIGKTTVAKAMLETIGADYIVINGSMSGGIETLRVDIANFASTVSFTGGRKYVILDEADYLTAKTQASLRNFMEEFSANCGFILTCNFPNKIIEPLHSRNSVIDFKIDKKDAPKLCMEFFKRVQTILEAENVEYDKAAVAKTVERYYPDWRRTLNELQRYSVTGKIDEGILAISDRGPIVSLIKHMKDKNFTEVRKWVGENSDMEASVLYRALYDVLPEYVNGGPGLAEAIVTLAEYQYKEAFVADSEINRAAAFAILMSDMDWKS